MNANILLRALSHFRTSKIISTLLFHDLVVLTFYRSHNDSNICPRRQAKKGGLFVNLNNDLESFQSRSIALYNIKINVKPSVCHVIAFSCICTANFSVPFGGMVGINKYSQFV